MIKECDLLLCPLYLLIQFIVLVSQWHNRRLDLLVVGPNDLFDLLYHVLGSLDFVRVVRDFAPDLSDVFFHTSDHSLRQEVILGSSKGSDIHLDFGPVKDSQFDL